MYFVSDYHFNFRVAFGRNYDLILEHEILEYPLIHTFLYPAEYPTHSNCT